MKFKTYDFSLPRATKIIGIKLSFRRWGFGKDSLESSLIMIDKCYRNEYHPMDTNDNSRASLPLDYDFYFSGSIILSGAWTRDRGAAQNLYQVRWISDGYSPAIRHRPI